MSALCRLFAAWLFLAAPAALAQSPSESADPWRQPVSWLPGWRAPDTFRLHSPLERERWRLGGYFGFYNHGRLLHLMFEPWRVSLRQFDTSATLLAANATYSFLDFPYAPISLELDAVAAAHFGPQNFGEFGVLPMFRWKWFPWNDIFYTTFRHGVIGASYTTALSRLEATDTQYFHTTRFLNFYVHEVTFAPSAQSRWEAFVRIHHRSGAYGRINGVVGGSNYVTIGVRADF